MIQLLIIAALLIVGEAALEAKIGDKRHWPSLTASVLIYLAFAFHYYGLDLEIAYSLVGVYLPVRFWFDHLYNFWAGNPPEYLGSNFTDRLWSYIPSYSLRLMLRLAASFGLLILVGIPDSYGVYAGALISLASLMTIGYYVNEEIKRKKARQL